MLQGQKYGQTTPNANATEPTSLSTAVTIPQPTLVLEINAGDEAEQLFWSITTYKETLYQQAANELAAHDLDAYMLTTYQIATLNETLTKLFLEANSHLEHRVTYTDNEKRFLQEHHINERKKLQKQFGF